MPKSDVKPRTKSRNGCHTCKRKRLKCDETKPECLNCRKRKIQCGGYAVNFKWKSFNENEATTSHHQYSGSDSSEDMTKNDLKLKQHLELVSISVTGKSINEINKETELISLGLNPYTYKEKHSESEHEHTYSSKLNSLAEAATLIDKTLEIPTTPKSPSSIFSTPNYHNNCKSKQNGLIPDIGRTPSSFSAIVNFAFDDIDALNLIEAQTPVVTPHVPTLDLDMNTSLIHTSEEQHLLYLYSEYTCNILSIKNGLQENPWRELILPQAIHYSCLYNSIASMTLFHLSGASNNIGDMRAKGYSYMKKCIFDLLKGLSKEDDTDLPADIALVTCLNLAFIDSWYTPTKSGIAHLKGAKSMIERVLKILSDEKSTDDLVLVEKEQLGKHDENGKIFIPKSIQFLFNVWIYLEVLVQMTTSSNQDDKGVDLVAAITAMSQQTPQSISKSDSNDTSSPTDQFTISPLLDNFNGITTDFTPEFIDPLLGCGQSLFSIMGKVANLSKKIRKSNVTRNSLTTISTASNLRQQLLNWKPPISSTDQDLPTSYNNSTWDVPQCIASAEAYKYATLIYLHQSVPEIPSLSSHKLAEKIFFLLASIPEDSNMHVVSIFPWLVAACEAYPGEEREWCNDRWKILFDKMGIGNIERALDIVKEVWKRKDEMNDKSDRMSDHGCENQNGYDQMSGLRAVLNDSESLETQGIHSRTHWSSIMKEWRWEVLLG